MTPAERRKMGEQRAARLLRDAARDIGKREGKVQRRAADGNAQDFWDLIDTSGGLDACHPWGGRLKWNHYGVDAHLKPRYQQPVFEMDGFESHYAQRLLVFLVFGVRLEGYVDDVTPICGDHQCLNVRHLAICPHSADRNKAIPVAEWVEAHR